MTVWRANGFSAKSQHQQPATRFSARRILASLSFVSVFLFSSFCSLLAVADTSDVSAIHSSEPEFESTAESKRIIEVGVLAIRGHLYAEQRWQPTLDWLESQIPDTRFVLRPLDLPQMAAAVESQHIDLVLTNPGQAVRLGRQYALSWLATLSSTAPVSQNHGIGSTLVVRNDSPYQRWEDIAGHPVAAVAENAFGGYLTLRYQITLSGGNPDEFFADVHFLGFPIDANLYQLRDHTVEAAVVPACLLENMVKDGLLEPDAFRVINNRAPDGFPCQVSTALYPNWSFAKTERTSASLAKQVSRALLAMPADSHAAIAAGASGWTSPVSLLAIDKLYQELDIHPLQQPWWQEALRWLKAHQEWGWGLIMLIVFLNAYHFWLEYRFSRSQKSLEAAQLRLKEKSDLLEHAQRVAIVGELGSSLAHEINQPLAAIRNYSEGGMLRLQKHKPHEEIIPVMEKIQEQVDRADAIIRRLRTLIQKRSVDKTSCDMESLIHDTVALLAFRLNKQGVTVSRTCQGAPRALLIDAVGIQQVLVNLLNNAMDACEEATSETMMTSDTVTYTNINTNIEPYIDAVIDKKNDTKKGTNNGAVLSVITEGVQSGDALYYRAQIEVCTNYMPTALRIQIIDNGTGLRAGNQENISRAFNSSKPDGLGLGLAICRDIIEAHGGELTLANREHQAPSTFQAERATQTNQAPQTDQAPQGCIATITLPYDGIAMAATHSTSQTRSVS